MHYPTHLPLFFPHSLYSSPRSPPLVNKEMACGGFRPEIMVAKQVGLDDVCRANKPSNVDGNECVSGEDLFVDQLLNLDDDNAGEEEIDNNGPVVTVKEEPFEETQPSKTEKDSAFVSPLRPSLQTDTINKDEFRSVLSTPAEDADLEWLSQFVEESFSAFSTPYPTGFGPISDKPKPKPKPEPEAFSGAPKAHSFTPSPPLNKARRSKRTRTGCRVWSTALAEPTSASSSSSSSTTTSSAPSSQNPDPEFAPAKKQMKRETGSGGGPTRRCSHCGVQKTPQWRTGPLGAKTLCNACGVRYKSGRLLPEYRPACSPTFSSELHSNNHRKVLEMRRKKEVQMTISGQPESNLAHPVPSFG